MPRSTATPFVQPLWRLPLAGVLVTAVLLGAPAPPADEQDRVRWLGEMRHIAVFEPLTAASGSPLLLVLGEPGRSARYALKSWHELAEREGFIVAAVSSQSGDSWRTPQDGPGLLRVMVQRMASRRRIDPRRIYLFGADTGGRFALSMGLLQPRYFAAVASFGGGMETGPLIGLDRLERPLPALIYHSKRAPQFDVEALEQSAAALREAGAEVEVERLDVGTDFERHGRKVAGRIWTALSAHVLNEEPSYQRSRYDR